MGRKPKVLTWTDEWVRHLPHPNGAEVVYSDPQLNGHRLIVSKTKKVFEIQRERPRQFGPRRTYKVQLGDALTTTVEEARTKAIVVMAQIKKGLAPSQQQVKLTTLSMAWERFQGRKDIKASTLKGYRSHWKRHLLPWAEMPLQTLVQQPALAEDLHQSIVDRGNPVDANRVMRILRAIYNDATERDTTLPRDRNPCTSVRWADEKARDAAIPLKQMAKWADQVEQLRRSNPVRAAFHKLCLLLGTRPGELARVSWSNYDTAREVLVLEDSKKGLYEIPLSLQAIAEIDALRDVCASLYPNSPWLFPADSKSGHIERCSEPKKKLSHSGNSGRHSFKTIATIIGISDLHSDVLQGRSLLKAGLAGRGYIGRSELTEPLRSAAQRINDEMEGLMCKAQPVPQMHESATLIG